MTCSLSQSDLYVPGREAQTVQCIMFCDVYVSLFQPGVIGKRLSEKYRLYSVYCRVVITGDFSLSQTRMISNYFGEKYDCTVYNAV